MQGCLGCLYEPTSRVFVFSRNSNWCYQSHSINLFCSFNPIPPAGRVEKRWRTRTLSLFALQASLFFRVHGHAQVKLRQSPPRLHTRATLVTRTARFPFWLFDWSVCVNTTHTVHNVLTDAISRCTFPSRIVFPPILSALLFNDQFQSDTYLTPALIVSPPRLDLLSARKRSISRLFPSPSFPLIFRRLIDTSELLESSEDFRVTLIATVIDTEYIFLFSVFFLFLLFFFFFFFLLKDWIVFMGLFFQSCSFDWSF